MEGFEITKARRQLGVDQRHLAQVLDLSPQRHTVFAYVIEGEGYFDQSRDSFAREAAGVNYFDMSEQCTCGTGTLVLYSLGKSITVTTEQQPVRFLLVAGRPLGEPVAWRGPIVMNTQEELRATFREYPDGTFLRHARS